MKYKITSDLPGYLRLRFARFAISEELSYSLTHAVELFDSVDKVECNYVTGSLLIHHKGNSEEIINQVNKLDIPSLPKVPTYERDESIKISMKFKEKLATSIALRFFKKYVLHRSIGTVFIVYGASKYVFKGLKSLSKGNINVDVLDGAAIGASVGFKHFSNAASIMFLLKISDILEEYTREKTMNSLVSALSFNVDRVWVKTDNGESKNIPTSDLKIGDHVIIYTGTMIPVDGTVIKGKAGVNQSSMTGESFPVLKDIGDVVFAGTVVTEGEIIISVDSLQKESRIQNILNMVRNSENAKSKHTANAEHIADRIVPYSFLFSGLIWLLTGNSHKALSALTVDYSCAIKLATPIAVISAISEASYHNIMVKGGKYLEFIAESDVIVFDKTGTLTVAKPMVKKIIPMSTMSRDDILKLSACLEEHYPHSLARAIVEQAEKENINHKEEHTEVEYIVSHGVLSTWKNHEVRIGSAHFLFEDNGIKLTKEQEKIIAEEGFGYSCVYLALDDELVGVICIEDAPRPEAYKTIEELRKLGINKVVMLTGDGPAMAKKIAIELNIDSYISEILPENKALEVKKLQQEGYKVMMIGDGVNDTPALSQADVSISLKDASDVAREVADITLLKKDLYALVDLKNISRLLMDRIENNFQKIFIINTSLLLFGAFGIMQPTTTALLHNISTAGIGLSATRPLLTQKKTNKALNN